MFEIPSFRAQGSYPWALPLSERLRMLRQENRRIAYFYESANTSSFRYRAFNMVEAINEQMSGVSASWFYASDRQALQAVAAEVEVLVVCRAQFTAELAGFVALARANGARIIYDTDDLIFDVHFTQTLIQTIDTYNASTTASIEATWNHWFGLIGRHGAALELADEAIATNAFLAERIRHFVDIPTHVVPNFMGRDQCEYSQSLVRRREVLGNRRDGFIDVGYFSGTPTHNKDFSIASGAIARLMRRDPRVRLRLVGFLNVSNGELAGLEDRIVRSPLVPYLELQRLIAVTEVNVAPLQDNIFTNCKSELKYFDAGAVAVPTLASPTFTMAEAINSGDTGVLVPDDQWDEALSAIVDDYETVGVEIGRAAYADAYARYTGAANVAAIQRVMDVKEQALIS